MCTSLPSCQGATARTQGARQPQPWAPPWGQGQARAQPAHWPVGRDLNQGGPWPGRAVSAGLEGLKWSLRPWTGSGRPAGGWSGP